MADEQKHKQAPEKGKRIKLKRGRKEHKPTEQNKRTVLSAVGMGMSKTTIGALLGLNYRTLQKYYKEELDTGVDRANMAVAKSLYGRAISGKDTIASIFWLKARAGWQDTQKTIHEGVPEKITVSFALKPPIEGTVIDATPISKQIEE
jgi:glucose dehydrogenase